MPKGKRPKGSGKGQQFEREMCRLFTKWVCGEPRPERFWRSATSGAKATMDRRRGIKTSKGGDFESIHPSTAPFTTVFSVEFKFRKDQFAVLSLIQRKGPFWNYWNQSKRDAEQTDKKPLLVFKRNRGEIYIAYPTDYPFFTHLPSRVPVLTIQSPSQSVSICLLSDWMKNVNYYAWMRSVLPPNRLTPV